MAKCKKIEDVIIEEIESKETSKYYGRNKQKKERLYHDTLKRKVLSRHFKEEPDTKKDIGDNPDIFINSEGKVVFKPTKPELKNKNSKIVASNYSKEELFSDILYLLSQEYTPRRYDFRVIETDIPKDLIRMYFRFERMR